MTESDGFTKIQASSVTYRFATGSFSVGGLTARGVAFEFNPTLNQIGVLNTTFQNWEKLTITPQPPVGLLDVFIGHQGNVYFLDTNGISILQSGQGHYLLH